MKGVKPRKALPFGQAPEWNVDGSLLNESSVSFPSNPSLHVSITSHDAKKVETFGRQLLDEEHYRRLVSIGEKVGRLAHDIRNPLSSIEWFATLLGREHHSQEERQELAGHCIQAVRSLEHLVSNMVVFSAPLPTQRESVSLLTLLDDVELLAMYPLRKKRLTVHRYRDGQLSAIKGHESLLKQVLLNLLLNAIHASEPDRSIEIHCRNESRLLNTQEKQSLEPGIVLRIRDYGCGMSEEELSNMFRPFYSNRQGGTGLGLSIVKQIIHIHRGLIDITSQQGKGTVVELFFPQ